MAMRRFPLVIGIAGVVIGACADDSDDGSSSPREDVCVLSNGQYTCAGRTWPQCASAGGEMSGTCDTSVPPCMACKDGVAAISCSCQQTVTDGGTSSAWLCVGAGRACRQ